MKEEDRKLWTERIEDYRFSGLTPVKWSEKNDVSVHKLRYYINKFNKEKKQESNQELSKPQWAAIVPKKEIANKKPHSSLNVIIGKSTIEVAPGFDQDTFKDIVRILSKY